MVCPYCSTFTEDPNALFCENCGSRLDSVRNNQPNAHAAPVSNYYNAKPVVPEKKKSNTLIICICVIIATAIICSTAVVVTVLNRKKEQEKETTAVTEVTEVSEISEGHVSEADDIYGTDTEDYLFPTHNTYLTFDILSNYSKEEIDLICNEMYARHGQIFKKEKNRKYFESQSWYQGKYDSMEYVVTLFNKYEKANLELIADYRRHMGWS